MKKILLIEDDTVMRENTAEILELAGYGVTTAPNGKKGIQLAKEIKPDLIVCDIMMPELDGYGVLHILAKEPSTAAVPFIFLTAKAEKSELRKGMELGADDYLTKPFDDTELLKAIETRLKKSSSLRDEFERSLEGLNQFLDGARGLKELEGLSRNRPMVRYGKKEVIFHEGDTPTHAFFLVKGKVKTSKSHADGKDYMTSLHKEGEFFGYVPLFENAPYSDSAIASEDCDVVKIAKNDLLALLSKNRDVAAKFIQMLSNNVTEKERQLLSLAYDTVRKRIAEALLTLAKRYGQPGRAPLRITTSRDDLAAMAGTATETVIRSLSEFKADKLVEVDGRDILLLDIQALEEVQ